MTLIITFAHSCFAPSYYINLFLKCCNATLQAHFNAPIFYRQLKDASVPRYLKVVKGGFGMSILLYAVITSLGFLTFGGSSSGIILNNYASGDTLMGISRFAVAVSLLGSYPLVFTGARDGILDLFQIKNNYAWFQNTLTVSMLAAITGLACVTPDVTFVLSFVGATLGNSLIYVFPALMFRGAVLRFTKQGENRHLKNEAKWAMGSAGFGVFMGILGAKMALQTLAR